MIHARDLPLHIYCNNGIFMSCGKKKQVIAGVVSKAIVMEPVRFLASICIQCRSRLSFFGSHQIFSCPVPRPSPVWRSISYYIVFHSAKIRAVRCYQEITIGISTKSWCWTARIIYHCHRFLPIRSISDHTFFIIAWLLIHIEAWVQNKVCFSPAEMKLPRTPPILV